MHGQSYGHVHACTNAWSESYKSLSRERERERVRERERERVPYQIVLKNMQISNF